MMKIFPGALCVALCIVCACGDLVAQQPAWQPSAGHSQLPLWPGEAPNAKPVSGPEALATTDAKDLVAGRPYDYATNVSKPTITVYSPKGKNTGTAVLVFPGGGYEILAMDLEGTEICDWLTSRGITAVLLKYRVPTERVGPYAGSPLALQDAQRALGLVRFHATEWHIDPHKIGVIGFSAGGHMVAAVSTNFDRRTYPAVDVADKESCRPDFGIALYPGHLWSSDRKVFELNPDLPVTPRTPPTFLLQAEDDPVDSVNNSLVYYVALKKAGVPVEMHLYPNGGQAFGMRRTKFPITEWPKLVETWLASFGMIPA